MEHIRSEDGSDPVETGKKISWFGLFKHRQMWGMMAGFFCVIWIWNIFITFLPLYLHFLKYH